MNALIGIANQVKADRERDQHLGEKAQGAAMTDLNWREIDAEHLVAEVAGGSYVLRKVDSRSRVARQRYRWLALWVPTDSPHPRELALEKRKEWARAAAAVHYRRSRR
jgi:hypothetical protein